jgi:hypothetical protein
MTAVRCFHASGPAAAAAASAVSVPFIVVVKFEGDKLKAERIYWDQVTHPLHRGERRPSGGGGEGAQPSAMSRLVPAPTAVSVLVTFHR